MKSRPIAFLMLNILNFATSAGVVDHYNVKYVWKAIKSASVVPSVAAARYPYSTKLRNNYIGGDLRSCNVLKLYKRNMCNRLCGCRWFQNC